MKRKTAVKPRTKPRTRKNSERAPEAPNADQSVAEQFYKYLQPNFTQRLLKHMHRAKQAALESQE